MSRESERENSDLNSKTVIPKDGSISPFGPLYIDLYHTEREQ